MYSYWIRFQIQIVEVNKSLKWSFSKLDCKVMIAAFLNSRLSRIPRVVCYPPGFFEMHIKSSQRLVNVQTKEISEKAENQEAFLKMGYDRKYLKLAQKAEKSIVTSLCPRMLLHTWLEHSSLYPGGCYTLVFRVQSANTAFCSIFCHNFSRGTYLES